MINSYQDLDKISKQLGNKLLSNNLTITTAESCTGGLVSSAITAVAGSSSWFNQAWVTYSNQAKHQELNIDNKLLDQYGAVSEQVAIAMAKGALVKAKADLAIATSGVAGPDGGTKINPVGSVWIAIIKKDAQDNKFKILSKKLNLNGDREAIRHQAVYIVLEKAYNII